MVINKIPVPRTNPDRRGCAAQAASRRLPRIGLPASRRLPRGGHRASRTCLEEAASRRPPCLEEAASRPSCLEEVASRRLTRGYNALLHCAIDERRGNKRQGEETRANERRGEINKGSGGFKNKRFEGQGERVRKGEKKIKVKSLIRARER